MCLKNPPKYPVTLESSQELAHDYFKKATRFVHIVMVAAWPFSHRRAAHPVRKPAR
jgi:hypothetical protein